MLEENHPGKKIEMIFGYSLLQHYINYTLIIPPWLALCLKPIPLHTPLTPKIV